MPPVCAAMEARLRLNVTSLGSSVSRRGNTARQNPLVTVFTAEYALEPGVPPRSTSISCVLCCNAESSNTANPKRTAQRILAKSNVRHYNDTYLRCAPFLIIALRSTLASCRSIANRCAVLRNGGGAKRRPHGDDFPRKRSLLDKNSAFHRPKNPSF